MRDHWRYGLMPMSCLRLMWLPLKTLLAPFGISKLWLHEWRERVAQSLGSSGICGSGASPTGSVPPALFSRPRPVTFLVLWVQRAI